MPNLIDHNRKLEVSQKLIQFFGVMRLQTPSNFDKIVTFCYDDIYKQVEFDYTGLKDWDIYRMALSRWIEEQTTDKNLNPTSSNKYFNLSQLILNDNYHTLSADLMYKAKLPLNFMKVKQYGNYKEKAFHLHSQYRWILKKDSFGATCLIPTAKFTNNFIELYKLSKQPLFNHVLTKRAGFRTDRFMQIRSVGEYTNKAFYLDIYTNINWEIKRDRINDLCLIPTKK